MRGRAASDREPIVPVWQIPILYILTSMIVGYAFPRIESAYFPATLHAMSVNASIAFFSAISSGMMALTGIVFAIGFVLLQFSAVAYSPRLTPIVTGDPRIFHTLGISMATFVYSLVTLLWTDRNNSGTVPLFSAVVVIALVLVSMFAFARTILLMSELQIGAMLEFIGAQGRAAIAQMELSDERGGDAAQPPVAPSSDGAVQTVDYEDDPQYIISLDVDGLLEAAQSAKAVIALDIGIGDSVVAGMRLLRVCGAQHHLSESALQATLHMARSRRIAHDPKYALRLLVDIAIRALSPAVNDPTTAVDAIDQLEDLMRRLGRSKLPSGRVYDERGDLRIVIPTPTWDDYLKLAFDEIRQYGATSLQVMRRLNAALRGIAEAVSTAERREPVIQYALHLDTQIRQATFDTEDRSEALKADRQGLGLSRDAARIPD